MIRLYTGQVLLFLSTNSGQLSIVQQSHPSSKEQCKAAAKEKDLRRPFELRYFYFIYHFTNVTHEGEPPDLSHSLKLLVGLMVNGQEKLSGSKPQDKTLTEYIY